jgi:hypothetical protein
MAGITPEIAQKHLDAWLAAELSVSTGQEYRIGTRTLRRADLAEIRKQIDYWRRELANFQRKGRNRVFRVIPRDL